MIRTRITDGAGANFGDVLTLPLQAQSLRTGHPAFEARLAVSLGQLRTVGVHSTCHGRHLSINGPSIAALPRSVAIPGMPLLAPRRSASRPGSREAKNGRPWCSPRPNSPGHHRSLFTGCGRTAQGCEPFLSEHEFLTSRIEVTSSLHRRNFGHVPAHNDLKSGPMGRWRMPNAELAARGGARYLCNESSLLIRIGHRGPEC